MLRRFRCVQIFFLKLGMYVVCQSFSWSAEIRENMFSLSSFAPENLQDGFDRRVPGQPKTYERPIVHNNEIVSKITGY